MNQQETDQLYHLLRRCFLGDSRDRQAVVGLTRHILGGGDYLSLIQFSAMYGEKYLLQPTAQAIKDSDIAFSRIVELGAGLGWLSRGLASYFAKNDKPKEFITIDKRPWGAITLLADLESPSDIASVKSILQEQDLIVMADFLHCVIDPEDFISSFGSWPIVMLESMPSNPEHLVSFHEQLAKFWATSFSPDDIEDLFTDRETEVLTIEPYVLVSAGKRKL